MDEKAQLVSITKGKNEHAQKSATMYPQWDSVMIMDRSEIAPMMWNKDSVKFDVWWFKVTPEKSTTISTKMNAYCKRFERLKMEISIEKF